MVIKPGDIVGRKSYGCDVVFKVCNIVENRDKGKTVLLKGVNVRLLADSPEADLIPMSEEDVDRDREVLQGRSVNPAKARQTKKGKSRETRSQCV